MATSLPGRYPIEGFQRALVACWSGLGFLLLAAWPVSSVFYPPHDPLQHALTFIITSIPFFLVATFYWRAWPAYRAVLGVGAVILALYSALFILMGPEWPAGRRFGVPLAVLCIALGGWSLVVAVSEPSRRPGAG